MGAHRHTGTLVSVSLVVAAFILLVFFLPHVARAVCNPSCIGDNCPVGTGPSGQCNQQGNGILGKTCQEGPVTGTCTAVCICKGQSHSGQGGEKGGGLGMEQLMQALKALMDALKPKDGGGSPPSSSQPPTNPSQSGCTSYYQTSSSTEADKDPCAYFAQGGVSSYIDVGGTSSEIGDAFGNISDMLWGGAGVEQSATSTDAEKKPGAPIIDLRGLSGTSGLQGDILVTDLGVTIFAGSRDAQANSEVSGFYGSANTFGQSPGLIARLCTARPWATNFLSAIISPIFFDNLCTWRGYRVGQQDTSSGGGGLRATSKPILEQNQPPRRIGTSTPSVPAAAEIWAVPAAVPLGARTSIFWNARGVETCVVSSDDGNFSERTISGGASTVPLTDATIFTITCKVSDGTTVTDSVRVSLSI